MDRSPSTRTSLLLCIILALVVFASYYPVLSHGFVAYDDIDYVYQNSHVNTGLTFGNIKWAFTKSYSANWHPLTWISHMADCSIYGLKPAGHHATNLIFHILNTILLFLLLSRLTKRIWPSVAVALLFGVHPLHVESVAWTAERKDVLSTFLLFLTIFAYLRYVDKPNTRRYTLVVVALICGLCAKPMLVTAPFLLLILDYWPLGRMEKLGFKRLVMEKLPLLPIVVGSCAITWIAQRTGGAVATTDIYPLSARIPGMFAAYAEYLYKMIWPIKLACYYPYVANRLPTEALIGAVSVLTAISIIVWRERKRHPYFVTGWLWYLITLIPVIGLVQVGDQAWADRYTYVPLIGPFLAIVWTLAELVEPKASASAINVAQSKNKKRSKPKKDETLRQSFFRSPASLVLMGSLILPTLCILTWHQVGYWSNTLQLIVHDLDVVAPDMSAYGEVASALTGTDFALNCNLAKFYENRHEMEKSVWHWANAVRLHPMDPGAHWRCGKALSADGKIDAACVQFAEAVRLNPQYAYRYLNDWGMIMGDAGRWQESESLFERAINIRPQIAIVHGNMATALYHLGDYAKAWSEIEQCRRLGGTPAPKIVSRLSREWPE